MINKSYASSINELLFSKESIDRIIRKAEENGADFAIKIDGMNSP
jgi:hypothetical protein